MESTFSAMMSSTDRPDPSELGASQIVIQQYARYPPTLESALRSASSLGSARSQVDANKSPSLHRKETPRSIQSSPRGMRSALPPSSAARSGPSMSPPVFDALRHQQMKDPADQAESRLLPSREITDETIDDAYVLFVLYCNPNVPSSVDTTELRRTFRCPPRSDGKSFSVFTLFELIRKLDNKELKTWIQLAIELGVEPPSMEKKQSTQKVQQYAVRLKRWMRAMHVDAFFEYCLGHHHTYYTQLPPSGPFVSESRDGVPLEEDLALRALVPQWKPKRGRKRAEERELEEEKSVKRPQLDTSVGGLHPGGFPNHSVTFPQSAIPFSAFPDDDPWMTASSSFPPSGPSDPQGQDLRWRFPERETSPAGYPQSAIIPRGNQPSDALASVEPRSAVTPSSSERTRARRRHGPAVSSAWPSSNGSSTGKSRGRPSSKTLAPGSFSTFQVNGAREPTQVPSSPISQSSHLVVDQNAPESTPGASYHHSPTPATTGRPSKLQLQVPQHMGAPVRLATPPTLLVNGVNGAAIEGAQGSKSAGHSLAGKHNTEDSATKISIDDIVRVLSEELLRAHLTGRAAPLKPDEAHELASGLVANLSSAYSQVSLGFPALHMAIQLGVAHRFGLATPRPSAIYLNIEPVLPQGSVDGGLSGPGHGSTGRFKVSLDYSSSHRFSMQLVLGHIGSSAPTAFDHASNTIPNQDKAAAGHEVDDIDLGEDNIDFPASETSWKQRYMRLRAQMQKKESALSQYKRKIVESVMADI
ncbi:ARS binding protein 2 [Penicillium argentinense]|uniref:ARS binding protein 2 n=1 Tax=Penicillium argentinense TaxID=1131581 RepID=A0A9W9KF44_9EURO|nr:ARS binding protein 2 [Penicillium argentinense]KAJ5104144.1 ARS binding protein 2 [Penicillium argentinense]